MDYPSETKSSVQVTSDNCFVWGSEPLVFMVSVIYETSGIKELLLTGVKLFITRRYPSCLIIRYDNNALADV